MRHGFKLLALVAWLAVSGCAVKTTALTETKYSPTSPDDVKVFATEKPKCDLEEIGLIRTPLMWNQERAVKHAKEEAAEIGAEYMQITDVKRNMFNDAAVNAVAYRCRK